MIDKRVVLILGAGASMDDQFPSGAQLVTEIVHRVRDWIRISRDPGFDEAWLNIRLMMQETGAHFQKMCQLAALLESAPVQSIDYLLGKRTEFIDEGKCLIAHVLIGRELPDNLNHLSRRGTSWYQYLWNMMETEHAEDFKRNRLSVITYNYDRSFDFFLRRALIDVYNLSDQKAADILSNIPVIHLHGALGELAVEGKPGGRPYESKIDAATIREAVAGIRVIHEQENYQNDQRFSRARDILEDAEVRLVLGFGYNAVNVRRLGLGKYDADGTTFGLTEAEVKTIQKKLMPNLNPRSKTVYDFLRAYGLEWTYS